MAANPTDDNVLTNSGGETSPGAHASSIDTEQHQPTRLPSRSSFSSAAAVAQSDEYLAQLPPRSAALETSPVSPSGRKQQFRRLVSDIAEHLDKNDVDKVIWQKELPKNMKDKPALAVLEWLYSHGEFSINELRPLTQLLKGIHREDLTGKVELFQEKFGRHSSLPLCSPKPHLSTDKIRANTLSGDQTSLTHVVDASQNHDQQKSPQQEIGCGDSGVAPSNSSRISRQRNSSTARSISSGAPEALSFSTLTVEGSYLCSTEEPFVDPASLSHDQMHQSHDLVQQSHDTSSLMNNLQTESSQRHRMPKQTSFELLERTNPTQAILEGHRMHRSSSSNTTNTVVRPLEVHSLGSSFHGNISDLPPNTICGQPAWRFNSNPSSGNVSQENILASSHSDVSIPTSFPRVSSRPLPPPYHQRAFSNSHKFSQDQPGVPYHPQSPGSYHVVNQQVSPSGFPIGDFSEPSAYVGHNYYPHQHGQCIHSLSQSSSCQYCNVQPCVYQQNSSQSQEHVIASVHGHHHHQNHNYHYRQSSGCNCGSDSRCASQASMRQLQTILPQPPQSFPTAYPSTQNIAQHQFHPPSYANPSRPSKQPPTRHLSLMNPQDTHQSHVGNRYSGYGTDGSGDDVFHSYSGDHLLAAPERSHTHPTVGVSINVGSIKMAKPHMRQNSHDALSDHTESITSRRSAGQSGARGSEVSMDIPYVGPAVVEKKHSRHVCEITSHSSELNDSDSGFTGSAPHDINGDTTRRSFTPSTSAKIHNELKKLPTHSSPAINRIGSSKGAVTENAKQLKQMKKKPSSISREQEEDTQSDDNIPVVYKDDENDARWTRRSNGRAIVRGAVQYRSLRYDKDRQIHRRKPNRSSLQSFDGNTVDGLDRGSRAKHTATKSQGTVNGSSHSLRSKSSQDNLTNLTTSPNQPSRNNAQMTNHIRQHSKDDKESTSASCSKHLKTGMDVKSNKDTAAHFDSSHPSFRPSRTAPDTDSPASVPQGARGTIAVPPQRKSWLSSKLHLRSKPQVKLIKPNELVWPIKRDKLNKYIYESKYANKALQCKHKLEPKSGIGNGPVPKLKFELHPYGLEEDRNENVTVTVHVERPKQCKLHSSTELRITLNIRDADTGEQIGELCTKYESIRSSYFLVKEFVSHESIKRSRCNFVEINVEASLVASERK